MRRMHRMPFGAEPLAEGGTRFRLWAPAARSVDLCLESEPQRALLAMAPREGGWFELALAGVGPGARYRFAIDGARRVPDPASRFQPDDVHGASEVVDSHAFDWPDGGWRGRAWEEAVLYELHVGAFTAEGTFGGVARRLDHLTALGVTAVELMPVGEWPGRRNWGYDGVYPFAPDSRYGRPDALKALVAAAHKRELMVFLDVVYNHFGPEGNYLHLYAPQFFTDRYKTPWGAAINFDGGEPTVRDFFVQNALYWLEEFNLDGLRLDAVHAIFDASEKHILVELAEAVRARTPEGRHVHLVLENDDNIARFLARDELGRPRWYAAQWNDDIHHACHVLASGEAAGYYADYADDPAARLGRALAEGFAYQGEVSAYRGGRRRGEPSAHLPPTAFVAFLQNHDQVGNRAFGERIESLASAEAVRALAAILLLAPSPPLLFMGEEWGAREPFPFFCDFGAELACAVRDGRRREFARFPQFQDAAAREHIPDPNADTTFEAALLDWSAAATVAGRERRQFFARLLALRRNEIVPRLAGIGGHRGTYARYGPRALSVTGRLGDGAALRLVANLGPDPAAPPPDPPEGKPIFATHPEIASAQGPASWPGWSVAWFLVAPQ